MRALKTAFDDDASMKPLSELQDQWPTLSRLLDDALDLPAAERGAWLAALSVEDALKQTLARLLATPAVAETGDFMCTPPKLGTESLTRLESALAGAGLPRSGDLVGPWRLLSLLGEGGMGSVWLAERADGSLQRQIALKLPRLTWAGDMAERLARERLILSTLEHPRIARLYDAGIDPQGRPWLALAYVQGQSIDKHARSLQLSVKQRVRLLLQVCEAVAFAHSRLVIHRDLKPANILVSTRGEVHLLDFGIAKLLEGDQTMDTELTRVSGRSFTPQYASPEQVRGEPLTTASDVYSLGVVAYQLLSDALPYRLRRGSAAEMESAVEARDVPLASSQATDPTTSKALRGDLDAILNRTLKRAAGERYATATALAEDLKRHLDREPVLARPDGPGYHLRRFVQRHRLGVAMSSALVLSVMVGGSVALWQAQESRAQAQRAEAEVGRQEAVRTLYLEAMSGLSARVAADPTVLSDRRAVTNALRDTLRIVAPRYATRPWEWHAILDAVMVQLNFADDFEGSVAVGEDYLESVKTHRAPAAEVIGVHIALGRSLMKLNRAAESEAIRRAGLAWAPEFSDARTEEFRLYLRSDLGLMLSQLGRREEALQILDQAERAAALHFPTGPLHSELQGDLAAVHAGFDDAASLRFARQAVAMENVGNGALPVEASSRLATLGLALLANGEAAEAETVFAQAHPMTVRMFGPTHGDSLRVLRGWGQALVRQGRHQEARALVASARDSLSAKGPLEDAAARRRLDLLDLEIAFAEGDLTRALSRLGPRDGSLPTGLSMRFMTGLLASEIGALALAGRGAEALQLAEGMRRAWPSGAGPTAASIRLDLMFATAQLAAGFPGAARETLTPLIELLRQHASPANWALRVAIETAAVAAARSGDAQTAVRELATVDDKAVAPSDVDRAESLLRQAEVLAAAGRKSESQAAGGEALANLRLQHPSSPRLRQAQRAAGLPSSN